MLVVSANMPVERVSTASPNRDSTAARASSAAPGSASWYWRDGSAASSAVPARSRTPS